MKTSSKTDEIHPVVRRFLEDAGRTTQSFGFGRVVGQIYAYLYFSRAPKSLSGLQQALGISKGSASTGVRQLMRWDAVRKVWRKGDRKDYFEANDGFGRILRNALLETVSARMNAYTSLLDDAEEDIERHTGVSSAEHQEHLRERLQRLRHFHERAHRAWNAPLVQRLLK